MSGTSGPGLAAVARARKPAARWLRISLALAVISALMGLAAWVLVSWFVGTPKNQARDTDAPSGFSLGRPLDQRQAAALPPPPEKREAPPPERHDVAALPPPPDAPAEVRMKPMEVWQATNLPPLAVAAKKALASAGDDDDDGPGGTGSAKDSPYSQNMQATRVDDARPRFHRFPPRYTLRKGLTFGCTPPMPIDTQLPGPLWCDVDHDVPSMDGTFVLIPAHSVVNGTIEHGLGLGQNMAVIVFTDVLTAGPDFLPIPLGSSLGASELGQNGVPVDVQEHEWAKIKNTLMFAAVEGISGGASAALQKGGGNQYFGSFGSTGQSLAAIAFQHDMNIPTTGYRGPGYPLKVYVNHYIDLSNFYSGALRRGRG